MPDLAPAPFLIGTDWITTPETIPVHDPYLGTHLADLCLGSPTHLTAAIASAEIAFTITRQQAPCDRSDLLSRIVCLLERDRSEFVELIVAEAGKPRTLAEGELTRALSTFRLAAELARATSGHLLDLDAFAPGRHHIGQVQHFPLGVIYAITPFNFPLNLVAHKLGPALATGNTVLLKPSPRTTLIALRLGRLLLEAGITPGQVNIVPCANENAALPLADPRVRMLSFTGGDAVGWHLKSLCLRQKVTLELGGNAAAIVHSDAILEDAIPLLATGSFAYSGQSCISTQRILVHESIFENFRGKFVAHTRAYIHCGDPREAATVVGPMIHSSAVQRTLANLAAATHAGATILLGGTPISDNILPPTIVEVQHQDSAISCEEAFAPIVTLQRYTDWEHALRLVDESRFGMQVGIFTQDINRIHHAFATLDVGTVLINQAPTFRAENQPYGGTKDSSFGREGVRNTMEDMTQLKSLIIRLPTHA